MADQIQSECDGAKTTHRHQDGSEWAGPNCEAGETLVSPSAAYIVDEMWREIREAGQHD